MVSKKNFTGIFLVLVLAPAFVFAQAQQADVVHGDMIVLNENGAWSWWSEPVAIVDTQAGLLLVSTIADSSGKDGETRNGDVDIVSLDLKSGKVQSFVLHPGLEDDDHNPAAILRRADGRYIAMYSRHNRDTLSRYRISTNPGDISRWEEEKTFDNKAKTTYSNLFYLQAAESDKRLIYNFTRTVDFDPNFLISDDEGESWKYGGRLFDEPGRPYVRYASTQNDVLHVMTTDQHPRNYDNSIYHGYIKNGKLHKSDGTVVDKLDGKGVRPRALTTVFKGDADNVAWGCDMELDADGHPYIAFSVQKNSAGLPRGEGGDDHRYFYARWDGKEWHCHEIAYAGSRLFPREDDYTGLVALDPRNPDVLYISTNADPVTGKPLISQADNKRHHELFKGVTSDGGKTWKWTPITENSSTDNLRPIVPASDGKHNVLLWLRGEYPYYRDYNLKVVALILDKESK